jgi:hypothetical protein
MARQRLRKHRIAAALVAVSAIALMVTGAAYAFTAASFNYSNAKTGYITLTNMAFAADNNTSAFTNSWHGGLNPSGASSCFNVGVVLPLGSHVKSVTFFFNSGPNTDPDVEFLRKNMTTGGVADLIHTTIANDAQVYTAVTLPVPASKQGVTSKYGYGIGVCPAQGGGSPDTVFHGARVKYTYTSAGS